MFMENLKTPFWNLDTIYSGFQGDDYKAALKNLDEICEKLKTVFLDAKETCFSEKEFFSWLDKNLKVWNKLGALYESLSAFCYCTYSVDTTNTEFLNALNHIEKKYLVVNELDIYWGDILLKNEKYIERIPSHFPQYANYDYIFRKQIEFKKHEMSLIEENLAKDLQSTGGDAWSRLQQQLISNLIDEETGKTFNQLRNEAYAQEREVRKTAYEKELFLLKQNEIAFAACLNNIKGETICLNKRRSWDSALDRSCFASRLNAKTLSALIGAIENSLPFWQDYLHTKARIMNLEKCAFYDLFAPLPSKKSETYTEKIWTFPEACKYIIEKFSAFSLDMGNFAKMAFDENWIDATVRKGKVGGAYCQDFPLQKVSRVLSNFTGTFSDITTLAHELGHAYHHWCIKELDYSLTKYPMTLAETASIFAETILIKDAINNATGYEKAKLIEMHLSDSCQVLVDILSRFYFERSVFEERKTTELSAEDFCRLMIDAQNKTYGEGLSEEKHPFIWAVKVHYYSPHLDFYNFPYAFGLLFATALFSRYQKEKSDFANTYVDILRNTGSFSCEDICKKAGFDIENQDFWQSGIETFFEELKELKEYE
ncbi:MAG: M3 family oligoendopeptidase [Treponema sp.]|nr:M3 family oligoendopeptidase [Treponema sp.]